MGALLTADMSIVGGERISATADDVEFALRLADLADGITAEYFEKRNFTLARKIDETEVTQADFETEEVLRAEIARTRPNHAFYGEESGTGGNSQSRLTWVVDPIDGTANYARGVPVWATLIALVEASAGPILGVVSAPALHRRWWASAGHGAFVDGRQLRVSDVDSFAAAQISVTFGRGWEELGLTNALVELQRHCYRSRGFGDFWQHMLVAEGAIDIAVDAVGLSPYDNAAIQVIVEEAGGRHTDRLGVRDYTRNSAISTNGRLHDRVISMIRSPAGD